MSHLERDVSRVIAAVFVFSSAEPFPSLTRLRVRGRVKRIAHFPSRRVSNFTVTLLNFRLSSPPQRTEHRQKELVEEEVLSSSERARRPTAGPVVDVDERAMMHNLGLCLRVLKGKKKTMDQALHTKLFTRGSRPPAPWMAQEMLADAMKQWQSLIDGFSATASEPHW